MTIKESALTVYYDGSCPGCVRDRRRYEKIAGKHAASTLWIDITGKDDQLKALGINPQDAVRELHVVDDAGNIYRELDAYILLMERTVWLKPFALLIGLPGIKPILSWLYHLWVNRRLHRTGRI